MTKSAFLLDAVTFLRRNRASMRWNQGAASVVVKTGRVKLGVAAAVDDRASMGASEVSVSDISVAVAASGRAQGSPIVECCRQVSEYAEGSI